MMLIKSIALIIALVVNLSLALEDGLRVSKENEIHFSFMYTVLTIKRADSQGDLLQQ